MTFIGMDSSELRLNYAEKDALKQGFPAIMTSPCQQSDRGAMQNPRVVSELFQLRGKKLRALTAAIKKRAAVLEMVRACLPEKLASRVESAGLENGRLTLGVSGAVWASRLRYCTAALRTEVGAALHTEIVSVRIRVFRR
jgi:hypothetical protein